MFQMNTVWGRGAEVPFVKSINFLHVCTYGGKREKKKK